MSHDGSSSQGSMSYSLHHSPKSEPIHYDCIEEGDKIHGEDGFTVTRPTNVTLDRVGLTACHDLTEILTNEPIGR